MTDALSVAPVGDVAVTVTVPRRPVVVSVPVFETVATVGSDDVQLNGVPATTAPDASNADVVNVTVAGATTFDAFGETVTRAADAPGVY